MEKEFFLIDSDNLAEVRTRLYGYSIQAAGIYEQDNLTEDAVANLDGRGCYVYVEARDGHITIKQDLNGCWGIYLFRQGDYFALSNSFFRLLDHVKFKYPLTVNRDYCHYLLINNVSSHSYSETAVNEVRLVERNAVLHIDIAKKNLEIELIDYREHTVSLDTAEGMATLDSWVEFWSNVFHNVAQRTKFFQANLSGGFDTRIALAILLNSELDLNKLRINSATDGLHTHTEDYEIASKIAAHYGFKLNQPFPKRETLVYSINDIFKSNFYCQQNFQNLSNLGVLKSVDKIYSVDGSGGETIRGNWLRFGSLEKFINLQANVTKRYSPTLSDKLFDSVKNILEAAFSVFQDKYHVEDPNSLWLAQYLYQDTRCRHHFGKGTACAALLRNLPLSPVFDPQVRTLRFNTAECPDHKLLMAVLFTRYAPDLLKFPFQGKRSIAPETIAYAQKLNERFPRPSTTKNNKRGGGIFNLQPRDLQAEKILAEGKNNPNIPGGLPIACLKAMFESNRTYGLFTAYFDEELYRYAENYYKTHVFGRERRMYAIVGVTRVLEDVEISQRNHSPYHDMRRFLEQDSCKIPDDNAAQILDKFSSYFTARVDIKFVPNTQGDFQIISTSDDKARVSKPAWFNRDGIGYTIQSYAGKLEIVAKSDVEGRIRLRLKGLDVRTPENKSKRIPYWVDYTKLVVNDEIIFDTLTPAWHDKQYGYALDVKANDEIKIQVEWLPHRSDV